MRTTLTLDPDVAALVEQAREGTKRSLKDIVNDGLRRGLTTDGSEQRPSKSYVTVPTDLGGCLFSDLDDVAGALAIAEGDDFR